MDRRLFLRLCEPCWLVKERQSSESSDSLELLSWLTVRQLVVEMLSDGSVVREAEEVAMAAAAAAFPSLFVWLSHSRRSKAMRDAMFLKPMLVPEEKETITIIKQVFS